MWLICCSKLKRGQNTSRMVPTSEVEPGDLSALLWKTAEPACIQWVMSRSRASEVPVTAVVLILESKKLAFSFQPAARMLAEY